MVVVFDLHNITTKYWTFGKGLAIKFWHGISVHVFVLEWN